MPPQMQMEPIMHAYPPGTFGIMVGRNPEGDRALVILIPGIPGDQLVFPLSQEQIDELGHEFTAPHVALPTGVKV